MNEHNFKLKQENSGLKKDLEKFLSGETSARRKRDRRKTAGEDDVIEGKIDLHGTMEDRLDALDNRETELLKQVKKQQDTIKRLRDDVSHYKDKYKEKLYVNSTLFIAYLFFSFCLNNLLFFSM